MKKTLVTFVLDRSSSMQSIKPATLEGFNAYLAGLKSGDAADLTAFTLVQFDTQGIDKVYVGLPVKQVPDLTNQTFQPRGGTPLIEAAFKTIKAVEKSLEGKDETTQVVISIMTDGEENSSGHEYTWASLSALVQEKQAAGWQFNFMGAGIDAYQQGAQMGISTANTMSYNSANLGMTRAAFSERGGTTALYASGAVSDMKVSLSAKMAAGDTFDPSLKAKQSAPVVTPPAAPPQRPRTGGNIGDLSL